ncbi:MAG: hypothetical protein ABI429_00610 [Jatrophihabitantaceae bacterium]
MSDVFCEIDIHPHCYLDERVRRHGWTSAASSCGSSSSSPDTGVRCSRQSAASTASPLASEISGIADAGSASVGVLGPVAEIGCGRESLLVLLFCSQFGVLRF